jgi:hypothetical protein
VAMDIVFQRKKKQNSNRVKGVEVLSILARVKMQKKGNCINGLILNDFLRPSVRGLYRHALSLISTKATVISYHMF